MILMYKKNLNKWATNHTQQKKTITVDENTLKANMMARHVHTRHELNTRFWWHNRDTQRATKIPSLSAFWFCWMSTNWIMQQQQKRRKLQRDVLSRGGGGRHHFMKPWSIITGLKEQNTKNRFRKWRKPCNYLRRHSTFLKFFRISIKRPEKWDF